MKKNGFTLIEVLLAVVVIGILATIALPRLVRKPPTTKWESVLDEINNLVYYARQEAISNQKTYRLHFLAKKVGQDLIQVEKEEDNLEKPDKKIYPTVKSFYFNPKYILPNEIKLKAVFYGKQDQFETENNHAYCYIIPDGLVQEVSIHMEKITENKPERKVFKMQPFFGRFAYE